MLIKELNKLSSGETQDIKELVLLCNKHDGLNGFIDVDTSINFNKEMNAAFMLYDGHRLASVLTLFAPGSNEAEVSAMTLPQYRSRGLFTELLKRAEAELKRYGVPDVLFVCESKSEHGKAVVEKQQAKYDFAEYLLKYNHSLDMQIRKHKYNLGMHTVGHADIEKGIELSTTIFNDSYEGAKGIIQNTLESVNRELFFGKIGDEVVGMGAYSINDGNASINGLGILPQYRGKGYGKEMLFLILDHINRLADYNQCNIYLEVDSENRPAFELYKKSGFEVVNAWEYYRKSI